MSALTNTIANNGNTMGIISENWALRQEIIQLKAMVEQLQAREGQNQAREKRYQKQIMLMRRDQGKKQSGR